jgi:hypothetical protein
MLRGRFQARSVVLPCWRNWSPEAVLTQALEAARDIPGDVTASVLAQLITAMGGDPRRAEVLTRALVAARKVPGPFGRASTLAQLVAAVGDDPRREAVLTQALDAARAVLDDVGRASVLAQLAMAIRDDPRHVDVLGEALNAARAVSERVSRAERAPEGATLKDLDDRAEVMTQLATVMGGDPRRFEVLTQALGAARVAGHRYGRAHALAQLAAALGDEATAIVAGSGPLKSELPDLHVRSVRYASPGWIELIGALHPLKIVSDFVTRYRQENSARRRQELAFQLELLDRMTPELRDQYAPALLRSITDLGPYISDPRVGEITVIEVEP